MDIERMFEDNARIAIAPQVVAEISPGRQFYRRAWPTLCHCIVRAQRQSCDNAHLCEQWRAIVCRQHQVPQRCSEIAVDTGQSCLVSKSSIYHALYPTHVPKYRIGCGKPSCILSTCRRGHRKISEAPDAHVWRAGEIATLCYSQKKQRTSCSSSAMLASR